MSDILKISSVVTAVSALVTELAPVVSSSQTCIVKKISTSMLSPKQQEEVSQDL